MAVQAERRAQTQGAGEGEEDEDQFGPMLVNRLEVYISLLEQS